MQFSAAPANFLAGPPVACKFHDVAVQTAYFGASSVADPGAEAKPSPSTFTSDGPTRRTEVRTNRLSVMELRLLDTEASRRGTLPAFVGATEADVLTTCEPAQFTPPRLGSSVTIDRAAHLLNISRRTVYNRIRDGRLRTVRTLGGSQRVTVESLFDVGFTPQAFSTSASSTAFDFRPSRASHNT